MKDTVIEILDSFSAQSEYLPRLILIDDCSPDHTSEVIKELSVDQRITGIYLSQNMGQSRAKMQGIPYIKGSLAVFMDDDGQHDPKGIFTLIHKLSSTKHIVYAKFPEQKESAFRRLTSRVTNVVLSITTGKPFGLTITSFFAVDATAIEALRDYQSSRPFIGGYLWYLFGQKSVCTADVPHRTRKVGTSTYSFKKLIQTFLALNMSMKDIRRYPKGKRSVFSKEKK
ncbi:MAG: glycosyltransferase [Blautia sp.]|nr:glycosyltransferase [Blautia sp.]